MLSFRTVDDDVQPDDRRSGPGPVSWWGSPFPPSVRAQYASWSPDEGQQSLVACLGRLTDEMSHVLFRAHSSVAVRTRGASCRRWPAREWARRRRRPAPASRPSVPGRAAVPRRSPSRTSMPVVAQAPMSIRQGVGPRRESRRPFGSAMSIPPRLFGGLVLRAAAVAASGSMSFSVRNMKKNTTHPIAAM